MKKTLSFVALVGASVMMLTGCATTLTSEEVKAKNPAILYYPGEGESSFFDNNMEWGFINSDHQVIQLECTREFFGPTVCVDEAGTVLWEPKKSKSSRYGYLTVDGGERTRFRCTLNFEGFEEFDPNRFCYPRES